MEYDNDSMTAVSSQWAQSGCASRKRDDTPQVTAPAVCPFAVCQEEQLNNSEKHSIELEHRVLHDAK